MERPDAAPSLRRDLLVAGARGATAFGVGALLVTGLTLAEPRLRDRLVTWVLLVAAATTLVALLAFLETRLAPRRLSRGRRAIAVVGAWAACFAALIIVFNRDFGTEISDGLSWRLSLDEILARLREDPMHALSIPILTATTFASAFAIRLEVPAKPYRSMGTLLTDATNAALPALFAGLLASLLVARFEEPRFVGNTMTLVLFFYPVMLAPTILAVAFAVQGVYDLVDRLVERWTAE